MNRPIITIKGERKSAPAPTTAEAAKPTNRSIAMERFMAYQGKKVFIQKGVVGYCGTFVDLANGWLQMVDCQIHGTRVDAPANEVLIRLTSIDLINHIHEVFEMEGVA